jgi:hypothetical protein
MHTSPSADDIKYPLPLSTQAKLVLLLMLGDGPNHVIHRPSIVVGGNRRSLVALSPLLPPVLTRK